MINRKIFFLFFFTQQFHNAYILQQYNNDTFTEVPRALSTKKKKNASHNKITNKKKNNSK